MDEEHKCKCGCFCSPANAQLMEAAVARFSERASFSNAQAMDASTFTNVNFQANATNTLNSTNESQLAATLAAMAAINRSPSP